MEVTVICPTYNRSQAIVETIASVRNQSMTDWELFVVSDGCTDDTEARAREAGEGDPRVHVHRIDRTGHPAAPRNHGLAQARGRFIAYIDHDDTWSPDHLAQALSALAETGADLVAGGSEYRDGQDEIVVRLPALGAFWHPQLQTMLPMFEPSRVVHRRGLAEQVGGWRSGIGLEDWDLWLRMTDKGMKVATWLRPTVTLRHDPNSRRYLMTNRHRLPIARFQDAAHAHAVMRELHDPHRQPALRAAVVADTRDWFHQMAATTEFSRPLDWDGDMSTEIERELSAVGRLFDDIVLVPEGSGFALSRILMCSAAEHISRIEELIPAVQPRQLQLINEISLEVAQSQPRSRARSAA